MADFTMSLGYAYQTSPPSAPIVLGPYWGAVCTVVATIVNDQPGWGRCQVAIGMQQTGNIGNTDTIHEFGNGGNGGSSTSPYGNCVAGTIVRTVTGVLLLSPDTNHQSAAWDTLVIWGGSGAFAGYFSATLEFTVTTPGPNGPPLPVPPPVIDDVYEIVPPGDTINFVGTLDDAFNKAIRPVLNEPGSGQFTINRNSPNATAAILKPGNLVKVTYPEIDPDPIFAWFMEPETSTLISLNEEGGEDITIGGRGALSYWDRVIWQATKYTIPWWPATMATPPAGTRGAVIVTAGTYRHYTIAGGVITGYANFTTTGFSAYFDSRQTYQWPSANSKRFLVHLTTTEDPSSPDYTGYYFHPHQDGVTEYLPSYATGTTSTVLLSDISADKPGAILYRMFQEGTDASRPDQPIPLMTIDFTATTDSNGDAWATTDALAGVTAELGETFLDTIVKLLATGVIDVEMGPDLDMHAYNAQGRDLTGTAFGAGVVRFAKGVNIADELKRERSNVPVATHIEVIGTDGAVGTAVLPDAASRVTREVSTTGDSNDTTVLAAIGLANLNARLIASDAIGFRIAAGDDDATGRYLPGPAAAANGDFWLGDLVTLHTGTGEQDFNEADERVYAVTIAEDEAGNLEVTPEVGSVLGAAERALYARGGSAPASFTARSQFSDTSVAETSTAVDDHIADTVDAHDASAVSFSPAAGIGATDVQAAIVEDAGDLAAHLAETTTAHEASAISFVPNGSIAATDVQAAIQEVRDEAGSPADILDIPTAETDTTLVLAPDGAGGVEFRAETGGGGSALTVEEVDGSPTDSAVTKIVFPNGTLGIASHVATYTPSGGGGTVPVYANAIPAMTSATAPSGTASDSEHYTTNKAWQAMSPAETGWITNASALPQWIKYQFSSAKTAVAYGFRAWYVDNFPSRTPNAWKFQGSNNNSSWTDLDTVSGFSPGSDSLDYVFNVDSPASYAYYRLLISANNGDAYTGVGRFEIFTTDVTLAGAIVYRPTDGSVSVAV